MLQLAVLFFAGAAVLGLILARTVLKGALAPWAISLLHAGLAASGLVIAGLAFLQGDQAGTYLGTALIILLIAALGGFFLASLHLQKKAAPKPVVVIHAGAAVLGFVILAGVAFNLL